MKTNRTSLAPTSEQSERLNKVTRSLIEQLCEPIIKITTKAFEQLHTSTKLERLLFACCVYYGGMLLIFKILGI